MTPESKTFQVWKDNPVPIYIEFFFFNWTNRDSLEAEGEMHIPQLQELGPYRFTWVVKLIHWDSWKVATCFIFTSNFKKLQRQL